MVWFEVNQWPTNTKIQCPFTPFLEPLLPRLSLTLLRYTPDQVQGRWSNLVTLYQRMIEHNSKPHNEPITIAYKEHIERVFVYVPERNSKWLKIMEKRGKTPKAFASKCFNDILISFLVCFNLVTLRRSET